MPTLEESKCCQNTNVVDGKLEAENISCITKHDGFRANCLNIHVLEASYYDYVLQSGLPEENQRIHELYRHIAYRRFTRWVYGLLGKRIRKVIPSCAVVAIREAFPSEEYCGFRYPQ